MTRLARKTKATPSRGHRSATVKVRTATVKVRKKKWGWGGARPGAGRPKSPDSGVPHTARPTIDGRRGRWNHGSAMLASRARNYESCREGCREPRAGEVLGHRHVLAS